MRYWWANQQQTYAEETAGGCLWCRQRRANGSRNPFYENVRLAAPGDVVFAYHDAALHAIGMVLSRFREAVCPFAGPGASADHQADVPGWLIDVAWLELKRPLRPAACMAILAPLLPETHAPLTAAGKGIQGGRLLEMPDRLARALLQLAGGTDPARILNPVWQPHQLRFCFAEAEMDGGSKPAAPPPVQAAVTTEECNA